MFKRIENQGLVYFCSQEFIRTGLVVHAFSSRLGGISTGVYAGLNLSFMTKDEPEKIYKNRNIFLSTLGIDQKNVVCAQQVHKDKIYRVEKKDLKSGSIEMHDSIAETDALITSEPQIPLMLFFADCVPILLLDVSCKAVAVIHAGWKGTIAQIAAKTVAAMQKEFNSSPKNILAAIGPSIGPCHYEVDMPVIRAVQSLYPETWSELLQKSTNEDRAYFDLWSANIRQLHCSGVLKDHIYCMHSCTLCNKELFFSHRGGMSGRHAALIMLR